MDPASGNPLGVAIQGGEPTFWWAGCTMEIHDDNSLLCPHFHTTRRPAKKESRAQPVLRTGGLAPSNNNKRIVLFFLLFLKQHWKDFNIVTSLGFQPSARRSQERCSPAVAILWMPGPGSRMRPPRFGFFVFLVFFSVVFCLIPFLKYIYIHIYIDACVVSVFSHLARTLACVRCESLGHEEWNEPFWDSRTKETTSWMVYKCTRVIPFLIPCRFRTNKLAGRQKSGPPFLDPVFRGINHGPKRVPSFDPPPPFRSAMVTKDGCLKLNFVRSERNRTRKIPKQQVLRWLFD